MYYELHVICGVNPHAVKGGTADLFKKKGKFEYSHINFWATRVGSNSAATDTVLFFAECSNDDEDDKETPPLCVPVFSSWISDGMVSALFHTVGILYSVIYIVS